MSEKPKTYQYTNTRPSIVSVGGINFVPGTPAEVSAKTAEALEKKEGGQLVHPLRRGPNPTLVPGTAEMPKVEQAKVPEKLPEDLDKAKALIRICNDLQILATWSANDVRPEIKTLILERSEKLAPKG